MKKIIYYSILFILFSCQKIDKKKSNTINQDLKFIFNEKINIYNPNLKIKLINYTNYIDSILKEDENEYRVWRLFITKIDSNYTKLIVDCGYPYAKPLCYFNIDKKFFFIYVLTGREVIDSTYIIKFSKKYFSNGILFKKHKTGEFIYATEYTIFADTIYEKKGIKDIVCPPINDSIIKYLPNKYKKVKFGL